MRVAPSLLVLALLGSTLGACNRTTYGHHTEPPMETELRMTPEHNVVHLRATLEPHWPQSPDEQTEDWQTSDSLYASVTLRWINLGPDPAPTVVELRGSGPEKMQPVSIIVQPNEDASTAISTGFDFDRCGTPCTLDLELAWHHAPSGELQVDWNVTASRSAHREHPSVSNNYSYRVTPTHVETSSSSMPVVAASPAARPEAVVD